jgi:hypothetical protein
MKKKKREKTHTRKQHQDKDHKNKKAKAEQTCTCFSYKAMCSFTCTPANSFARPVRVVCSCSRSYQGEKKEEKQKAGGV